MAGARVFPRLALYWEKTKDSFLKVIRCISVTSVSIIFYFLWSTLCISAFVKTILKTVLVQNKLWNTELAISHTIETFLCTWHFLWVERHWTLEFGISEGRMYIWDTEKRLDLWSSHFLLSLSQLIKQTRTLPEDTFMAETGSQVRTR